jgi:hypothetical protein
MMRSHVMLHLAAIAVLLIGGFLVTTSVGGVAYAQVEQPSYGEGPGLTGAQQLPATGGGDVYAQVEGPSYGEGPGLTGAQQLPATGGVMGVPTSIVVSLGALALLLGVAGVARMRRR